MKNEMGKNLQSAVSIFVICAVIFFVVGIFNGALLKYKQKHCTDTATAQIVRVEQKRKTSGHTSRMTYTAHFTYFVDDKIFNGHTRDTTAKTKYKLNNTIVIKFNPENSKTYLVENDITHYKSSYSFGIFLGAIALAIILCRAGKTLIRGKS
ncbi:MAG: DUF3592 domain-containing protein [Ruminococcus sp.]|nr:DUF3592 domain-containing protein [Ruminococcus sp.]